MKPIKRIENIVKRGKLSSWSQIHKTFGDLFFSLDGDAIQRGSKIPSGRRLPAIFDKNKVVAGDMIPITSWGSSLANLLTKRSWDMLRHPIIKDHHNVCELCGIKFNVLDVHEIWSYHIPEPEEVRASPRDSTRKMGVQRLEGLMAICVDCHRCFHLGKANVDGKLELAINRLAYLNHWTSSEAGDYYKLIGERWKALNGLDWIIDLSSIKHPEGFYTIKSPWTEHEQHGCFLTAPNQFGQDNLTALVGCAWSFYKDKEPEREYSISEILQKCK